MTISMIWQCNLFVYEYSIDLMNAFVQLKYDTENTPFF